METLKKFLKDLRFRRKNEVPIFESTKNIFFGKVEKNPNIKVEAKFACGSNGSTLSKGGIFALYSDSVKV